MKILVIRFSSLGDCVLLLPLLTHLKESGAKEIAVLTKSHYREIFACARGVDRMILLAENSSASTACKIAASLRKEQYMVIDAHNTIRSRLITALMREDGPRLKKRHAARLGVIVFKKNAGLPSMMERYFDLAEELLPRQVRPPAPGGDMILPESAASSAEQRLCKAGTRIIAVAPGARWPAKRWEAEKYARLVRIIIERFDYSVILLGDDRDAEAAGVICSQSAKRIFDFTGRTGLIETAALLKSCTALVCNDSGLLHLAEAVGTPVLSIFGPTTEHFGYYPADARSKVCERRLPCRPCSRNGSRPCFMGNHACLAEIRTDSVAEVFKDMMDGTGTGRYTLP